MTHDELIRKIKNIEKIEPSQTWIFSNKRFIFDYIQAQEKNEAQALGIGKPSFDFAEKINLFVRGFGARFLFPSAAALTVIFMTGNFVLAKSRDALPGDALYSVKIFAERVEVAMTTNEEARATLNFDLADKRLSEITTLAENADGANVSGPDVDVAMQNFNNHLSDAVSGMDNVVKSDSTSARAVTVAKIANSKTSDYARKIAKAKNVIDSKSNSSSVVKDQMAETIKKIEEVNFNALAVLVSLDKNNADQSISQEVSRKVEEKINEAMAKTDLIKEKISAADGVLADGENIKLASDLVDQAGSNLDEAKKLLAGNDSGKALEKLIASNDMTNTAEKITAASATEVAASPSPAVSPEISPVVSPSVSPVVSLEVSPVVSPSASPVPSTAPSVSPAASVAPAVSPTVSPSI